jgi:hypothetical protein
LVKTGYIKLLFPKKMRTCQSKHQCKNIAEMHLTFLIFRNHLKDVMQIRWRQLFTLFLRGSNNYLVISSASYKIRFIWKDKKGHWPVELVANRWEHQSPSCFLVKFKRHLLIISVKNSLQSCVGYSYLNRYLIRKS